MNTNMVEVKNTRARMMSTEEKKFPVIIFSLRFMGVFSFAEL
jgi:hypothetical protein